MDLIADIGATNARCALIDDKGKVLSPKTFRNADFNGIEEVLEGYVAQRRATDHPKRAALAIAAPITGDRVEMPNISWSFSQTQLKDRLKLGRLTVVNDFAALAWALPGLGPRDKTQIGEGEPAPRAALAVLGPGSGLGVASLMPSTDGWTVVAGEGGHVTLAAYNEEEERVIESVRSDHGHCSAERVLSGPGLVVLYTALAKIVGRGTPTVTPEDVSNLARQGEPLACRTRDMFFAFLGTVASNLALTVGARGGVYIGGGIVPQLVDALKKSAFRERFVDKGRYRDYLAAIPTYVITQQLPAFQGLRTLLGYRR